MVAGGEVTPTRRVRTPGAGDGPPPFEANQRKVPERAIRPLERRRQPALVEDGGPVDDLPGEGKLREGGLPVRGQHEEAALVAQAVQKSSRQIRDDDPVVP